MKIIGYIALVVGYTLLGSVIGLTLEKIHGSRLPGKLFAIGLPAAVVGMMILKEED